MSAHRRKHMSETLSAEEHTTLMTKRGELNWLATQSMIQLLAPTKSHRHVENSHKTKSQECESTRATGSVRPVFVSFADASWANRKDFGSQCGFLCVGTERSLLDGSAAPCCPISWHSRRCPRVLLKLKRQRREQEETEFIRLLWLEIVQGGYDDTIIDQEISKVGGCLIIDAIGVFDAIFRSESAALSMQDKRSAVEGLALREANGRTRTLLRWCHSEAIVADMRTTELTSCYASLSNPESGELCGILNSQFPRNSNSRIKENSQELRDGCTMHYSRAS